MPKNTSKTASKSAVTSASGVNQVLLAIAVLFFLGLAVVSFKYMMIKRSWNSYAVQTLHSMDSRRMMNSNEDAAVVAMTIGQFPSAEPLFKSKDLQNYVANYSKQTHRDLVVLDTNKMILADTIPQNVGKKYGEDKDGEIAKTIFDGQERSFNEMSADYPNGLNQAVVALKDVAGKTVGAVVLSTSPLFY